MSQHPLYPAVYEPIQIGKVEIKNRIYQTPHGPIAKNAPPEFGLGRHVYAVDPVDGSPAPHPDIFDYFEERARGGVGLIMMGHIEIQKGHSGRYHLTTPSAIEIFKPLLERLHSHETKVFAQLHCGYGSPSGLPDAGWIQGSGFPEAMTIEHIRHLVELAGLSAAGAKAAGFDGVELHAAHLHSAGMFLSGFTNRRTDEYGGSLENRMRFLVECLEIIRKNVGDDLAVGIRMTAEENLPGGVDAAEAIEVVRRLEDMGLVDFFDLDIGHSQHMWNVYGPHYQPESYEVPYIAKVRAAVRDAVVLGCPGRMRDPAEAQRIIESGAMDMVGGVRGFFADPEWPRKGLELRANEIRPCVGLNGCLLDGTCVMNPTNYLEALYGVTKYTKTDAPKKVVVIGGGPAGMEAARVAATRGHEVVLFEKQPMLGGALNLHAKIPTREVILEGVTWWTGRLEALGVDVVLDTEVAVADVLEHRPDVVAVATGSTYDRTGINGLTGYEIPGWDREFVHTPETLLPAVPSAKGNVIVLDEDGTTTASDIAWLMAQRGAKVELVTRHPLTARDYLNKAGNHRDLVSMLLHAHDVRISPDTFIRRIDDHAVTLFDVWSDKERVVDAVDVVVLGTLRHPRSELVDALEAEGLRVERLGDARSPGRMPRATRDGFFFGWNL